MTKALRLSEVWFRRGLWLVAVVFAGFLIGLGGTLVGDLPKVEKRLEVDDFLDRATALRLRADMRDAQKAQTAAAEAAAQARLKLQSTQADLRAAEGDYRNWLATRSVTQRAEQDPEVISRTRQLGTLRETVRSAEAGVERQQQALLDAQQRAARAGREVAAMEEEARNKLVTEQRRVELRVFLYRLTLTLPPLAIAGWLFRRHRHGTWWPFVWGFIFFALFTFFVELVPYLPSYGGYVRYVVGIVVTVLVGRYAIVALNRYLERQKAAEQMPDVERRKELPYDTALARLAKGVCPGCERPLDLKNDKLDFCPHCGIGIANRCGSCGTRKSAFVHFCHGCGAPASVATAAPGVPSSSSAGAAAA